VQQDYKLFNDIEILAGCTPAKVGESFACASVVSNAEENRAIFCKSLNGKPLFSALYCMYSYTVTLNELKAVLKVSAQERQSGAVNKTSVKSTAQDDELQEEKRHKRHISNNSSKVAKKSTKPFPVTATIKLFPKSGLTHNFFAPLRITDMDTETPGAENTLPEQEALRKPGRSPPIVLTSTRNLIRLQSDLKDHIKGEYKFKNTTKWNPYHNKRNGELFSHEILPEEK
jgi:hypothetical protein